MTAARFFGYEKLLAINGDGNLSLVLSRGKKGKVWHRRISLPM